MIKEDSTVVLRTKDAIYCTCKIVAVSKESFTVTYCAGTKMNRKTGEYYESRPVETISRKEIISISERN